MFPSHKTKNTETCEGAATGSSCSQGLAKHLNKRETSFGDSHGFHVLLALTANGFKSKSKQNHLCTADIHNQVPNDRRKISDSVKIQRCTLIRLDWNLFCWTGTLFTDSRFAQSDHQSTHSCVIYIRIIFIYIYIHAVLCYKAKCIVCYQ